MTTATQNISAAELADNPEMRAALAPFCVLDYDVITRDLANIYFKMGVDSCHLNMDFAGFEFKVEIDAKIASCIGIPDIEVSVVIKNGPATVTCTNRYAAWPFTNARKWYKNWLNRITD